MNNVLSSYRVIGLMSGSSLDGLDIACCEFTQQGADWHFKILHGTCAAYDAIWVERLRSAYKADAKTLWQLHADFGHFCGRAVADFVAKYKLDNVLCVASHGHTIFHFPQQHFTTQIGDGASIAAEAKLPVVCDFRSLDVAKNGQGAPLVPIGDQMLLSPYKFLLNLGGIANLTIKYNNQVVAFDICCANQVLNFYALQTGQPYDRDGALAAQGQFNAALFDQLNALDYFAKPYPKSLDNGYSRDVIIPLIEQSGLTVADKLNVFCEHIAYQISRYIKISDVTVKDSLLATGGGALNKHLMRRIAHHVPIAIAPVDDKIIQYKEALVFALMGLLRWRQETNVLASVTGADKDSSAGAIYLP